MLGIHFSSMLWYPYKIFPFLNIYLAKIKAQLPVYFLFIIPNENGLRIISITI